MSPLCDVVLLVCIWTAAAFSESCYKRSLEVTGDVDAVDNEEFETFMVESIKTQILQKLRMTEPPQVIGKSVLPEVLLRKYQQSHHDDDDDDTYSTETTSSEDDFYGTTREVIIFPENSSDVVCPESSTSLNSCLKFQLTEELTPETVKSAELWLHTRNSSSDYSYVVSEIKRDAENNVSVKNVLATLHPNSSTWGTIDVGETMRALSQNRNFTFILEVSCVGCGQNLISPVSTENLGPFILVSVCPQSQRSKRTSTCGGQTTSCCVENFRLSFKDIGWDTWIIQPEAYNANYCRGSCIHDLGLARHHYTTVIRNYIQVKGDNTTARLCCVPDKLSSLYLIYRTLNNTLKHDRIPRMAVESCDCA